MRYKLLLVITSIILLLNSCTSKEDKIKEIIDNSYFGVFGIKKMSEIDKLDESIFELSVHSLYFEDLEKYFSFDKTHDYYIVRYIYRTFNGGYRIFYIVDYTDESIVKKSSDPDDFFIPIGNKLLGEDLDYDLKGDDLFKAFSY